MIGNDRRSETPPVAGVLLSHESKQRIGILTNLKRRKITDDDVLEIRELVAKGELTDAEIGALYGVHGGYVSNIASGRRRGHVQPKNKEFAS